MPLTKEVVSFPFAAGLDEKSSDKTTPPGKLVTADNVRFEKTGQLIKREAYIRQSNAGVSASDLASSTISSGKSVIPHKDGMLVLSNELAYKRTGSGSDDTPGNLIAVDPFVPCSMTHEFVSANDRVKAGNSHSYTLNGLEFHVYVSYEVKPGGSQYLTFLEILDDETKELVYKEQLKANAVTTASGSDTNALYEHPAPQLVRVGDYIFIFINDAGTLKYTSCNTASGLNSALNPGSLATTGITLDSTYPLYSVDLAKNYFTANTLSSSEGNILVAYYGGTDLIKLHYLTRSSGSLSLASASGSSITWDVLRPGGGDAALSFAVVGGTTDENPVVSGLQLSCLNDIAGADTDKVIAIMYTADDAGSAAMPQATFFAANLSANETIFLGGGGSGKSGSHMVTSGAASITDGGVVHFVTEIATEATVVTGSSRTSEADRYSDHEVWITKHTRGSSSSQEELAKNCSVLCHPFRQGSLVYTVLVHYACSRFEQGRGATSNMFLVDTSYEQMHAAGTMGNAPIAFGAEHTQRVFKVYRRLVYGIQRVQGITSGKYQFGCSRFNGFVEYQRDSDNTFQNDASFGPARCTIDFNLDRPVQYVESGKVTLFTGGCLFSYDGEQIVENNFITAPKIVKVSSTAASGNHTQSGDDFVKYMAVWEATDAQGNVSRSMPSQIESLTYTNNKAIEIEVLSLPMSRRRSDRFSTDTTLDVKCVLYRTVKNGTIFHRCLEEEVVRTNSTIRFSDHNAFYQTESLLEDNEPLYTTTELSNGFIGSCTDIAKHKSRIFTTTTENLINCSKPLFEGDSPAFVTDSLPYNIIIDGESNPITCIESNLEHLLIFTDQNGYILAGDGPDAVGGGGFLKPRKFAPGIGVLASSPHKVTREGALVATTRGIYLVKTNLAIEYIGAAVEDIMASLNGVVSIDVLDDTNEILIALKNNLSGNSDTVLRYNYAFQQWTRDTVGYSSSNSQVDACVLSGSYYRLTADGYLHKQDPTSTSYQDTSTGSGVNYNMVIKTGFIPRAGLQKSQRMYRWMLLGDYLSDFTLTVKTFTDYSGSADTTFTKSVTSSFDNPMQFRGHIDKQKSQAIAVEITAAGVGACAELDSLALEVGRRPAKTSIKLPATETL